MKQYEGKHYEQVVQGIEIWTQDLCIISVISYQLSHEAKHCYEKKWQQAHC